MTCVRICFHCLRSRTGFSLLVALICPFSFSDEFCFAKKRCDRPPSSKCNRHKAHASNNNNTHIIDINTECVILATQESFSIARTYCIAAHAVLILKIPTKRQRRPPTTILLNLSPWCRDARECQGGRPRPPLAREKRNEISFENN